MPLSLSLSLSLSPSFSCLRARKIRRKKNSRAVFERDREKKEEEVVLHGKEPLKRHRSVFTPGAKIAKEVKSEGRKSKDIWARGQRNWKHAKVGRISFGFWLILCVTVRIVCQRACLRMGIVACVLQNLRLTVLLVLLLCCCCCLDASSSMRATQYPKHCACLGITFWGETTIASRHGVLNNCDMTSLYKISVQKGTGLRSVQKCH